MMKQSYIPGKKGVMRVKSDFTVYPRKLKTGTVYYYQCYDEDGRRTNGLSTGERTRTMAVKKCNALLKAGKLLPDQRARVPTFAEYARDWWDWETCLYLKKQQGRRDFTESYIKRCRRNMQHQLVPYFGKTPLNKITDNMIEEWLVTFTERGKEEAAKNGSRETKRPFANYCLGLLSLMLGEAVKRGLTAVNPAANVKKLKVEKKRIEILSPTEVKKFVLNAGAVDASAEEERGGEGLKRRLARMANILAACTGMRIGEVLGLRGEYVYEDYIKVCGQYGRDGYGPTKTKKERNIPLTAVMLKELRKLTAVNGAGYVFSADGGATPISRYVFNLVLAAELERIGIDAEEKKRRNLTPHAWLSYAAQAATLFQHDLEGEQCDGREGAVCNGACDRRET
jgi:integrase